MQSPAAAESRKAAETELGRNLSFGLELGLNLGQEH